MTSLPATETSRATQPEGRATRIGIGQSIQEAPPRLHSDGDAIKLKGFTRESPDPFVATDRYRLNMPFADRL